MLEVDTWLSQHFVPNHVYKYFPPYTLETFPAGLTYCKVSSKDTSLLKSLIVQGFKIIETACHFEQKEHAPCHNVNTDFTFRLCVRQDEASILKIAEQAFTLSRFYQDKNIAHDLANRIKRDWVANYFLGNRGTDMIVCENKDSKIVGFLLLINNVIDLIATAPNCYRQGISKSMISFANQKFGLLKAGTQSSNHASIGLYNKAGFILQEIQFVLHKHVTS